MPDFPRQSSSILPPDAEIHLREIATLMAELRDGVEQGTTQGMGQAARLEKTVAAVTAAMDRFAEVLSTVTEHLHEIGNVSERLDRIEAKMQARETEERTLLQEIRVLTALLRGPV